MIEICSCEVCGNTQLETVLNLGNHPMCDDLVRIDEKRVCKQYPIEILFCKNCFTALQRFQVPKDKLFHRDYHYRARMTGSVLRGMKDFVVSCEQVFGSLENKIVLDVGCNDGSLLDFFKKKGSRTLGVEPTKAGLDSKHETINDFFNSNTVDLVKNKVGNPDLITFTNVFAHIEDLPNLIKNLKLLFTEKTKLVIENHYLGAIFNNSQFDTFYHEHPRTYSVKSFKFISRSLGMNLLKYEFVSRYGGNIRVFIGKGDNFKGNIEEENFNDKFKEMVFKLKEWKNYTVKKIKSLNQKYGPIKAKAFPGRAAILIRLLNLNQDNIEAVYEISGSKKVFHYVPGTKIPILPEEELYKSNLNHKILNLAWHIPDEVEKNLRNNNYVGEIINIKKFI